MTKMIRSGMTKMIRSGMTKKGGMQPPSILQCFKNLPDLIEASWYVEAALPFSALESEENLTAAVEITVPLRIFLILEMCPHVIVDLLEPLKALLVACELVSFDEADR